MIYRCAAAVVIALLSLTARASEAPAIPDFSKGLPGATLEKIEQGEGIETFHLATQLGAKEFFESCQAALGAEWRKRTLNREEMILSASKARSRNATVELSVFEHGAHPGINIHVMHFTHKQANADKTAEIVIIYPKETKSDPVSAQDEMKENPSRKNVAAIDREDPEMAAAQEKARASLITFVEAVQKPEQDKRYLLKVKLAEGDQVEHVWLEPVKWNDPGLSGILAVDPVAITKHKKGDVIAPMPEDVSDWIILSADGSKDGGFTTTVIEKRRAKSRPGQ